MSSTSRARSHADAARVAPSSLSGFESRSGAVLAAFLAVTATANTTTAETRAQCIERLGCIRKAQVDRSTCADQCSLLSSGSSKPKAGVLLKGPKTCKPTEDLVKGECKPKCVEPQERNAEGQCAYPGGMEPNPLNIAECRLGGDVLTCQDITDLLEKDKAHEATIADQKGQISTLTTRMEGLEKQSKNVSTQDPIARKGLLGLAIANAAALLAFLARRRRN